MRELKRELKKTATANPPTLQKKSFEISLCSQPENVNLNLEVCVSLQPPLTVSHWICDIVTYKKKSVSGLTPF